MIKEFLKVTSITLSIIIIVLVLIVSIDNLDSSKSHIIILKDYGMEGYVASDTINGHSYLIVKFGYGTGLCHDESCICKIKK